MALEEAAVNLFNTLVATDEGQAAFEAGYQLTRDPAARAQLGGPVVEQFYGGAHVSLEVRDMTGTWLHGNPKVEHAGAHKLLEDPAFVLGAVFAALETKVAAMQDPQRAFAEQISDFESKSSRVE